MATRAIASAAVLQSAAFPGITGLDSGELDRLMLAATELIQTEISPRIVIADTDDYDEFYGGSLAAGRWKEKVYLKSYPIIAITSIKENGVALTFGTGYDATQTKQVVVDYERGILYRVGGGSYPPNAIVGGTYVYGTGGMGWPYGSWASGQQNIEVLYRAGWEQDAAPADLVQWCVEEAVNMRREPLARGADSISRAGTSQSYNKDLSATAKRAKIRYSPYHRPRCY